VTNGNPRLRAETYLRAGLYLEAAHAYRAAGDGAAALANLTRVLPDHPRYREACVLAITLAGEEDRLSLALENFLARFLRGAPETDSEAPALDVLARLYERHGFPENAAEVLRKLSGSRPEYVDAARVDFQLLDASPELAALPPLPEPAPAARRPEPPAPAREPAPDDGPAFYPGAVIAGRYRLAERLGTGGMSVVFRATDLELDDEIAVKVLTQAVFDAETDARLRRELMLSQQIVHRNIVRTFEMGRAQGLRYLILELLRGSKLTDRMHGGPLPLGEGLDYLAQACAGLQAAHDLGVIHRDVKPGNFFIAEGGVLKVMDFGLAKVRDAPGLTPTGVIAGTPSYMAPEQASDFRSVAAATDIYALGVVAYEMFTARLPFVHENPLAVLNMHRDTLPDPPRSRNPSLPEALERIILRCLEKDPGRRFGNCREMGQHLVAMRCR
jgi:serine/threonine-protein kinase